MRTSWDSKTAESVLKMRTRLLGPEPCMITWACSPVRLSTVRPSRAPTERLPHRLLLFIAKDPVRYGALVYPAVVVAVLRIGERLAFAGELKSAFGIGMERTIGTIIVVGALNVALLVLKPRETYPPAR